MIGQQCGGQDELFHSFSLEAHVPANHLLRGIDRVLEPTDLRRHLASSYSPGRPSIDSELMIRMLFVGYCYGIRSERRLCEEVHLNLAYRWFCRLGLQDTVPDHSTFSKNRHGRFRESDAFRHVFESVVERSMAEGLSAVKASLWPSSARSMRLPVSCGKDRSVAIRALKFDLPVDYLVLRRSGDEHGDIDEFVDCVKAMANELLKRVAQHAAA